VDIPAFRQGTYRRRTEGMMPEAEIVFLDEIFKSNSAILNALLTLLNERKFNNGSTVVDVPLLSVFGASNEVPADESLQAIFDRFLLRVRSEHLDAYHFQELINRGVSLELEKLGVGSPPQIFLTTKDLIAVRPEVARRMQLSDELLATYKSLVFQIRAEGVSLSDRRVVKLIKLMAASAYFDGRPAADVSDLFILKHVWNTLEQSEILDAIVSPVLDGYFRSLGEIKAALQSLATDPARRALVEVDQLLEHVFRSGRISG
jgi:MoxR-like ATPase